jgi:hypothetical protein
MKNQKRNEPKVLFGNGMILTFEQHQKRVQHIIDSIISDASNPILSLMALYNAIADGEITWAWPRESLGLLMSSINKLDTKK